MFCIRNNKYYCRACNKYQGKTANIKQFIRPKNVKAKIDYNLSEKQINVSEFAEESSKEVYVDAVCGAGKTEIVFKSIEKAISNGQRVGFAVPRREVVREIYERLIQVYPTLNIVLVYGGHNEFLDGDIICLTCHQCYRYYKKFGLLILDEYDAFPLKGDQTLLQMCKNTSFNKIIYLSATFSIEFLKGKNYISLKRRHHNKDLPIPKVEIVPKFLMNFRIIKFIRHHKNTPIFIFCPTISEAKITLIILKLLFIKCSIFSSKSKNKDILLKEIRNQKRKIIVCTTILERGITVSKLNVIVRNANHMIFDESTLIQICGRVGRKSNYSSGKILFLTTSINKEIEKCIENIENKNGDY